MIITRTPLRLSFVGGGSDLPSYYREYGGAVLSTAIDKYVYLTVNKRFDHTLRVSYSRTEEVETAAELQHQIVRAVLQKLGAVGGLEITSIADVPSRGSGLGSSSAFTVGLLHAVHAYQGVYVSRPALAAEACEIEIDILGDPIGKQDQYGAAIGGMNVLRFKPDDTVDIEPVVAPTGTIDAVEHSLMMFYTGITRSASEVLRQQSEDLEVDRRKLTEMHAMVALVDTLRHELASGHADALGAILHEAWMRKRSLSDGISTSLVDEAYDTARAAGAQGGKLLGAGGGGFMIICAPPMRHAAIRHALARLRFVAMRFERQGTSVIFYH